MEDIKYKMVNDVKFIFKDIQFKTLGVMFVWALILNLLIEILSQFKYGGFFEAFKTIAHNPLVFLFNVLIIMVTLSISLLFKRTYFSVAVISLIWLALGVTNCIVLSCRNNPFTAVELQLMDAAMGVLKSYISVPIVVTIVTALVAAAAAILFVWKKAPVKKCINYFSSLFCVVIFILLLEIFTAIGLKTNIISTTLPNLPKSYVEYGFVYCFSNSLINTGISKPKNYSPEKVDEINDKTHEKLVEKDGNTITSGSAVTAEEITMDAVQLEKLPNIIFLQLESFFDINSVERFKFSDNPIPFFMECMNKYSSGYLTVPVVGAGTANTEFEVIAGMNLDFFGPGEYPYKTVLKNRTCETICYDLKPYGYTNHAIHNNRATFYGRNLIFSHFGFDYFTSMELINIKEYTQNGWAKDKVLTDEILKSIKNTETKDFVYTISVQAHGGYPVEKIVSGDAVIEITEGYMSEEEKNSTEYYISQIKEMDEFLKDLTYKLEQYKQETGEDVILVAFGDHLPTLKFEEEDLINKNQYQTQYFVWNTMNLPVVKEDLEAFQLSSRIMEMVNISEGEINSFHQANKEAAIEDPEQYAEDLKILCYDMFNGENYDEGGEDEYIPTEIKFGVVNVSINDIYRDQSDNEYLIIKGDNFTKYSNVFINDELIKSELVDANTLRVRLAKVKEDINISVKQTYKGSLILQVSNILPYTAAEDVDGVELEDMEEIDDTSSETQSEPEDWAAEFDEQLQKNNTENKKQ